MLHHILRKMLSTHFYIHDLPDPYDWLYDFSWHENQYVIPIILRAGPFFFFAPLALSHRFLKFQACSEEVYITFIEGVSNVIAL